MQRITYIVNIDLPDQVNAGDMKRLDAAFDELLRVADVPAHSVGGEVEAVRAVLPEEQGPQGVWNKGWYWFVVGGLTALTTLAGVDWILKSIGGG